MGDVRQNSNMYIFCDNSNLVQANKLKVIWIGYMCKQYFGCGGRGQSTVHSSWKGPALKKRVWCWHFPRSCRGMEFQERLICGGKWTLWQVLSSTRTDLRIVSTFVLFPRHYTNWHEVAVAVCACGQWRSCCGDSCSSSSTCQRAKSSYIAWEPSTTKKVPQSCRVQWSGSWSTRW